MRKPERLRCPKCRHQQPMMFLFPSPQPDAEIEAEIARFQECRHCGWQGDAWLHKALHFYRDSGGLVVDGNRYPSVVAFVKSYLALVYGKVAR